VKTHRTYVGIGTNLGDRIANVEAATARLAHLGSLVRRSSYYRSQPVGKLDQPWFLNVAVMLETTLTPQKLLEGLHAIEEQMGRRRGERWGPRIIDLDLLLYDDLQLEGPQLTLPHPRFAERAFVLVPLSEIDESFAPLRDALSESELAGVTRFERETVVTMGHETTPSPSERVRALAHFLAHSDAVRVRITRGDDEIEIAAATHRRRRGGDSGEDARSETPLQRIDAIRADLVGIFHLSRPAPVVSDFFDGDRELGFIEALGIRTPVHSMGAGRLVEIATPDGAPVEYGQALFLMARG
jgi:2-amino-4-hydroxy-6-hydroxymethyldihydropteridine diphosphokinase